MKEKKNCSIVSQIIYSCIVGMIFFFLTAFSAANFKHMHDFIHSPNKGFFSCLSLKIIVFNNTNYLYFALKFSKHI